MSDTIRSDLLESRLPPHFEGFPYLVIRIGHTPLRHLAVLPAELTGARLVDIARRQVAANRLDACLCLTSRDGLYFAPDGEESHGTLQVSGIPLTGRLLLPGDVWVPASEELQGRQRDLAAYVERVGTRSGYLVGDGLSGGRKASAEEIERLTIEDPDDPPGLETCDDCGWRRGQWLAVNGEGNGDETPRVVEVHCRCQNHNRCARCGGPLADSRLSAYQYVEEMRRVLYTSAYCGLSHRCTDEGWRSAQPMPRASRL